ncbi:cell wall-binding repeat-containing protein [Dactylosporangium sp. NPDC049525]|uniref:cell wall-binding repeat-containing protein n=1 Tax=Dactylosporangium sp. NPDC049525 TaxID=3154730 RepID=UPI00342970D3
MAFGLTRRSAILGAATAATAVAVPSLLPGQRKAHATPPGKEGVITFRRGDQILIAADAYGTNPRVLAPYASLGSGGWSNDGTRFLYSSGTAIESVRADGGDRFTVVKLDSNLGEPTFAYGGGWVIYSSAARLSISPAGRRDGRIGNQLFSIPDQGDLNCNAAVAGDGTVVYQQGNTINAQIRRIDDFHTVTTIIDGWSPDFSPDSRRIAFTRTTGGNGTPFVHHIWVANADGSTPVQLTTEANAGTLNMDPAWTTDGQCVLFTSVVNNLPRINRFTFRTGLVTIVVDNASDVTCQPIAVNAVERVWGQTALGTAIATSRYNWADNGVTGGVRAQAKAVVLSRDDRFVDALAGSALAVAKRGPLLITPTAGLHTQTRAEILRILGDTGTVYLLGGTLALSANIESMLKAMGFTVVRLWGQDEYATAVAVAKAITPEPDAVILATSLQYYDALAAGAAAGANPGTAIVLTAGDTMPAATAAYLNALNPDRETGTTMIAVGGPAVRALENAAARNQMPAWPDSVEYFPVYGATEFETAVAVADFFFVGPQTAAIATASTWFDALTGGAMVGANLGPLLLTSPASLSAPTRDYFSRNAASITNGVLIGGNLALPNGLIGPLGAQISAPLAYTYNEYTQDYVERIPGQSTPQQQRAAKPGRAGNIPGTKLLSPERLAD